MLTDYMVKKKNGKELMADKIINKITNNIGINDFYQMGAIDTLDFLIDCFEKESDTLSKDNLIGVVKVYRDSDSASKEIVEYADIILNKYE